jgi:hypothetical protein
MSARFRGTRDLKFRREEMAEIRAAEQALGEDPWGNTHDLPEGLGALLGALFLVLLLGLIGELVVLVVHSPSGTGTERHTAPASTQARYAIPRRPAPAVPEPRAVTSANADSPRQVTPPSVTNPIPAGVIVLRKFSAASETGPHEAQVLRPWSGSEPTKQRTVTMEGSSPAEPPPVTREDTGSGQIADIAVRGGSPRLTMPSFTMPVLKQPPITGNGSWHYFTRTTKPSNRIRVGVRQSCWPRQPAPRTSPFGRHNVAARGPDVPRRGFIISPPPVPGPIPFWGVPVCGCRWVAEGRNRP